MLMIIDDGDGGRPAPSQAGAGSTEDDNVTESEGEKMPESSTDTLSAFVAQEKAITVTGKKIT
eukprot:785294-Rhodomonas_salina.1